MPRRRWIDPSFWDDLNISKLRPIERLFFIGCFSNADDEGRLIGSPAYLRATIFKYDDMSLEEITEIRNNVASLNGNMALYEADGEEYLAFRRWTDYQKPNYPKDSKLPAPPVSTSPRSRDEEEATEPRENGDDMGRVGLGRVGLDRSGQDRSADGAVHSDLWKQVLEQLENLHDPVAIRANFAGSQLLAISDSMVLVYVPTRSVDFVRKRLIKRLADAISIVAPELAERELLIQDDLALEGPAKGAEHVKR